MIVLSGVLSDGVVGVVMMVLSLSLSAASLAS